MILLDTSVLVGMATDQSIRATARDTLIEAARDGRLFVSAVSGWELGLLATRTGRAGPLLHDPRVYLPELIRRAGLKLLPLDFDTALASAWLPEPFHTDPADRMLVATARARDAVLATSDRKILAYADAGHVRALAC